MFEWHSNKDECSNLANLRPRRKHNQLAIAADRIQRRGKHRTLTKEECAIERKVGPWELWSRVGRLRYQAEIPPQAQLVD